MMRGVVSRFAKLSTIPSTMEYIVVQSKNSVHVQMEYGVPRTDCSREKNSMAGSYAPHGGVE